MILKRAEKMIETLKTKTSEAKLKENTFNLEDNEMYQVMLM